LAIVAASFFDELSASGSNDPAMAKARYHNSIMLRPEPEGGSTALAALPGCATYGRTVDEARDMARDAITGHIASLGKPNDPVPTDDNPRVASLDFEYSRQEITCPLPSNRQRYPPSLSCPS
jgi:predicted RNase H-like HicB family nuclease